MRLCSKLDARLKPNRRPYSVHYQVQVVINNEQPSYPLSLEAPRQFGGTLADINTSNIVPIDQNPRNAELFYFCKSCHTLSMNAALRILRRSATVIPTDGVSRWTKYAVHTPQCNPAIADAVSSAPKNRHSRGSWVSGNIPPAGYGRNSEDDSSQRGDTCPYQRFYQGRLQQDVPGSNPICPSSCYFGGRILRMNPSRKTDYYPSTTGAIQQA